MVVKTLLIGISIYEIGLLYWLLCGTVLEKIFLGKKEWGVIVANIVSEGVILGLNRSLSFFHNIFLL